MDVGVIGIGSMGKNHVRVYSKIKQVENIYVVDKKKENVNQVKEFGVTVCDSVEELLKKVDAVSICVPTSLHFDLAKKVIENNVHLLIEKPITLNVEDGEKLIDLIDEDLIVGVGHIERFNPIIDEIFNITDNPLYIEIKRLNPSSKRITDSSIVKDLMIHDIDIIINVFFKNKEYKLSAAGNSDVCSCLFNIEDKGFINLSSSNLSSKKIRTIHIEQEEFTIEGDFMLQELYVYNKPEKYDIKNDRFIQENIIEKVLVKKVEPLFIELESFIKSIRTKSKFLITPEQAVKNLSICEEIERMIRV